MKKSRRQTDQFGQNGTEPNWNPSDFEPEDYFDLDLPDDGDLDWADYALSSRPDIGMDDFMQLLADEDDMPPEGLLAVFSDLSQEDAAVVRQRWDDIPAARRRWAVATAVRLAEEELQLALGRFLRIVLHDADEQVRIGAIYGLSGDVTEDLVGPLVQLLHNDASEEARAAAAMALGAYVLAGELDEMDAALAMRTEEALLAVLHNENEPLEVRCRALESIAFSGEAGVRQLIEEAYFSNDEELRVSAVLAMGRSADVRWRGKVCAELHNSSPAMRAEAAYAAGELEAHEGLRDLLEMLDDEDDNARLAAIFALGRLGSSEARRALEALAEQPESLESEAAKEALEEMQFFANIEAIPLFNELMDDAEWDDEEWDDQVWDVWADVLNDAPDDLDKDDLGEEDLGEDDLGGDDLDEDVRR